MDESIDIYNENNKALNIIKKKGVFSDGARLF